MQTTIFSVEPCPLELISSPTEIDTHLKVLNTFNKIKSKLNHHLIIEDRLDLLHSESQVDSHEECMIICNRIIDAIRSLRTLKERFYGLFEYFVPVIERVTISDIDTNEKRMNVLNKIIEAVNGLGKISLSSFLLFEFIPRDVKISFHICYTAQNHQNIF